MSPLKTIQMIILRYCITHLLQSSMGIWLEQEIDLCNSVDNHHQGNKKENIYARHEGRKWEGCLTVTVNQQSEVSEQHLQSEGEVHFPH